jgi:transposase InsO family protein
MRLIGRVAVYRRPNTSKRAVAHKLYPYARRDRDRTGSIGSGARTSPPPSRGRLYIPMAKGFLYLVAIIDWHRRAVLGRRLSNTLGTEFCVEVLQEALARHGRPEIFNTDQSLPQRRLGAASSPAPNSPSCSSVAGYDHHGWQRPLHGQRLHRAMVAQPEV